MTDPHPSNPTDAGAAGQPDYIGRSIVRVMRRTERALSPWTRGVLASTPAAARDSGPVLGAAAGGAPAGHSPAMALVSRVQRKVEKPGLLQRAPAPQAAQAVDRFASSVIRRFPAIASRYESRPLDVSGAVQRSELPFSGAPESAAPAGPSLADEGPEVDYPSITVSPEESVATQMATRLEALRHTNWSESQSPRQISRKASEVAAARSAKPDAPSISGERRPTVRRSRVEEIGPRVEAPAAPVEAPPPAARETVQRKVAEVSQPERVDSEPPAAPGPTPTPPAARPTPPSSRPPAPVVQRKAAPAWEDGPESEDPGPRPGLPSFARELTARFTAARSGWEADSAADVPSFLSAEPKTSTPEPRVQRSVKPPASAPAPAAPETGAEPPVLEVRRAAPRPERQPPPVDSIADAPPAPPAPAAPTEQPLVQRAVPPAIQRTPQAPPAESQPEDDAPPADTGSPPRLELAAGALQRKPAPPEAPSLGAASPPAEPPVSTPDARRPAPAGPETTPMPVSAAPRPAAAAPPAIQRTAEDGPSPTPAIQRTADDGPSPVPPVQRSIDDGSLPLPTPRSVAAPTPPVQRTEDEGPRPAPRPAAVSLPEASPGPTPPPVQRQADPAAPAPAKAVETGVEARTLTDSPAPVAPALPLAAPRPMARTQSEGMAVLPASRIQRKAAEDQQADLPLEMPRTAPQHTESPAAAPMAVTAQRPMAVVQRQAEPAAPAPPKVAAPAPVLPLSPSITRAPSRVQRENATESTTAPTSSGESTGDVSEPKSPAQSGVNLHDLARRIYPILKRMLAIERERR